MQQQTTISIIVNRRKRTIDISRILYIHMRKKHADIYMYSGEILDTRTPYWRLVEMLGENFIEVKRGCLVNVNAIHNITDKVNLITGETLTYTSLAGRKKEIKEQLYQQRKRIIREFYTEGIPASKEKFFDYYKAFDFVPIAFTDIEMIFDEKCSATDWVFCYCNQALADLEKVPLDKLIWSRFGDIFHNMDDKWLRSYERVVMFGETLGINDYSPEIDSDLIIFCFPTFKGHCGGILLEKNMMKKVENTLGMTDLLKLLPVNEEKKIQK